MSRHTAQPESVLADEVDRYGGKACGLAELERLGCRVPPWFVLPTTVLEDLLDRPDLEGLEPDDAEALADAAGSIRRQIEAIELPAELTDELRRVRAAAIGEGPVAVRSSAAAEDADDASFAGVHESLLFVETFDELCDALRTVWASAFSPAALEYRLRHGRPPADARVGVVIQRMVDPEVSGVAFTANPATGDVEETVVEAVWGAGEGLVTGGLSADRWVVDKIDGTIEAEVADKSSMYARDAETGAVAERDVPPADRDRPCLNDRQVRQVVDRCRAIEEHVGRPQDVEFVVDPDGDLYIVQSRAVTTVDRRGPAAGRRRVWDNSNIVESYAGTTTPMTFSFIQHVYAVVYRRFGDLLGIAKERQRDFAPELDHRLGLIRGRVYYNLQNWYDAIELLPGWRLNAGFLESMLGVDEASPRQTTLPDAELGLIEKIGETGDMVRVVGQTLWRFARIRPLIEEFEEEFEANYRRWAETDFDELSPRELMEAYEAMERDFLDDWGVPILNHYHVMLFHGLFEHLCEEWLGEGSEGLANDLLCGEGGIATKEASSDLLRLANLADERPPLRELLVDGELTEIHGAVLDRPADDPFRTGIEAYLDRYGYRSMEELKLEEPTLRERPERLYQMIRNYLRTADAEARDPEVRKERERTIRREAEREAFGRLGPLRRLVFERVLKAARFGVRNRENVRFARTRVYGLVRELLVAVGERLAEREVIEAPEDIFWLTIDEVWNYIRGTAVTTRLDALVELRREEFAGYRADGPDEAPDDRFYTYGIVYHGNDFEGRPGRSEDDAAGDWRGTGCSSGVVEGPVKVVSTPDDDIEMSGEILVARQTDPGWVSLFPAASALVVERGSPLSHSAIVAREMGLPAVVGVADATTELTTGDRIRVDGETGVIERLDS